MPEENATISIFDRGFLMADGVYEVITVLEGKLLDFESHLNRLKRSLSELDLEPPEHMENLLEILRELTTINKVEQGTIYLQITRGPADRDFIFPNNAKPSFVAFTQKKDLLNTEIVHTGMKIISIDDIRWRRRDIKTVQLLYPSMGKMMAKAVGCDDAWMIEDGYVTEGTSNNAYIFKDSTIITRGLSKDILHGVTRASLLRYAKEAQIKVEERLFTIDEAKNADEAFITSASTFVLSVVEIDGAPIGKGKPGPVATQLRKIYIDESRNRAT